MKTNLIMVPFAYKLNANTGVNIKRVSKSLDIYLKNCCVSLISARQYQGDDTDCALITNIDIPNFYEKLLTKNGILIYKQDFDLFDFGAEYRWSLAFYKLCALYRISRTTQYSNYMYLDSDVVIQKSLDDIFEQCDNHMMMFNLNTMESEEEKNHFLMEVVGFNGNQNVNHYGGEFFAANKKATMDFSESALRVFNRMLHSKYVTSHGDEFITSITAVEYSDRICDAKDYITRLWTGTYRQISNNFRMVPILHLPAEKEYGMLDLYDKYVLREKSFPKGDDLYKICHILTPSILTRIKCFIKFILNKE